MKNNYSYPSIDLKNYSRKFIKKRKNIINIVLTKNTDIDFLIHYNSKILISSFDSFNYQTNSKINTKTLFKKILNTLNTKKRIYNKYNKLIDILQKKYEITKRIYQYYNNLKFSSSGKNYNNIETLALFSLILLMRFKIKKNYNDLNTSLKIGDFIYSFIKKNKIEKSLILNLMFLVEIQIIEKIDNA